MAVRRDEVEAAVYSIVLDVLSIETALVGEVLPELVVNVVHTHFPTVFTVQRIAKTYSRANKNVSLIYNVRQRLPSWGLQ